MATLRKRPGPGGKTAWQVQIIRRGHERQYKTFDTKGEAEAWARQIEGEMDRGVFVSRAEAETTTLREALDRYEREVTPKKKSRSDERYKLGAWRSSTLAARSLASIRGKDLAAWRDAELTSGSATGTVRRKLALLAHVFKVARKKWGMESLASPVDSIQLPPPGQARDRRLVADEYARLLSAAQAYGGEIASLITWAIETAMRRGEIAAMRWEHLDRQARVLLIPETKNGTPRRIPLSRVALAALDTLSRRPDGLVWSMRPDSISQAFERVCKAAGITGLTFHDLRHEAASRLSEKGLGPMQVADITGHKTMQMVKRYTHPRAEDLVPLLD
ncbi:MAG: site-specific integrase [Thermaerobacter sp.]|nr:site-specific integrase [Gammaproteobacteria bacterium]MDA8206372.1 site-specific integrase [Thermaerobacter sp.]